MDLKRALSTLYYALFHELATLCADLIAGNKQGDHSKKAWKQCFRALEHGYSRTQCGKVYSEELGFPSGIKDFANLYVTLQIKRHRMDYSPDSKAYRTDVLKTIKQVESALKKLRTSPEPDLRAFCAFVLLKKRQD